MVYTLRIFFFSKCSLFHNSNVFVSCIIHILYTECAKIKKKIIPAPKGQRPVVIICTTRFYIKKFNVLPTQCIYMCVLCGSQSKQNLLAYAALSG